MLTIFVLVSLVLAVLFACAMREYNVARIQRDNNEAAREALHRQLISLQVASDTTEKRLDKQLERLACLIDFDGKISPLHFRPDAYVRRDFSESLGRMDRVACLDVPSLHYRMILNTYDFKEIPAVIPHVARKMAQGMTSTIEKKLTEQLTVALEADARAA